ncbi:MAG TPA: hypothetical protein VK843_06975 [Planctomycetota bacterium]|nr:hypothetical protein [Planctomycetota bacterium]
MNPWLGSPYLCLAWIIPLVTLVELASIPRVRRWNAWLTVLVAVVLLYQLLVSAVSAMARFDAVLLPRLVLSLSSLASLLAATVVAGMGARQIWSERAAARQWLSCMRGAGIVLVLFVFALDLQLALRALSARRMLH